MVKESSPKNFNLEENLTPRPENAWPYQDPSLTKEPVFESVEQADDWQDKARSAKSLEELKEVIPDTQDLFSISEVENFLRENIAEVVVGTMAGTHSQTRNELGRLVGKIAKTDDFNLRGLVRDLVKKELEKYFHQRESEIAPRLIAEADSFQALEKVVKQFKYLRRAEGEKVLGGEKRGQLEAVVGNAVEEFEAKLNFGYWQKKRMSDVGVELHQLLGDLGVPEEFGLRQKMWVLMSEKIETRRKYEESLRPFNQFKSWLSQVWSDFKSFWTRR